MQIMTQMRGIEIDLLERKSTSLEREREWSGFGDWIAFKFDCLYKEFPEFQVSTTTEEF